MEPHTCCSVCSEVYVDVYIMMIGYYYGDLELNPFPADPGQKEKFNLIFFIFTLLCGASKGFMKALTF